MKINTNLFRLNDIVYDIRAICRANERQLRIGRGRHNCLYLLYNHGTPTDFYRRMDSIYIYNTHKMYT